MPTRINDRNQYFSHNVRQLRMSFNMSQDELAIKLKTPSKHGGAIVSGWERGEREPSFTTLCKIADLFGVSTDWLLGRTPPTSPFGSKIFSLLVREEENMSEDDKQRLMKVIQAFTSQTL